MALLNVGDKAPELVLNPTTGEIFNFASLGTGKLILYFYPKDNTPGCTAESCNLRDNYAQLKSQGFEVIGVSPDSEKSHLNFKEKFELPFQLIPDTEQKTLQSYGVWGEKKNYGKTYMGVMRTTYIINSQGIIEKVFSKVDTKEHTAQLLG